MKNKNKLLHSEKKANWTYSEIDNSTSMKKDVEF